MILCYRYFQYNIIGGGGGGGYTRHTMTHYHHTTFTNEKNQNYQLNIRWKISSIPEAPHLKQMAMLQSTQRAPEQ